MAAHYQITTEGRFKGFQPSTLEEVELKKLLLVAVVLAIATLVLGAAPAMASHETPAKLVPGKFRCSFSGGGPQEGHDVVFNQNRAMARALEALGYTCIRQRNL